MKAYLIDAGKREILEIEYEHGQLSNYLPGGLCLAGQFANGDVLYVDDIALMRPATKAFRFKGRRDGQPLLSDGVLTGRDDPDPDSEKTLDPETTPEQLIEAIEWLSVPEALQWFRDRHDKPAVTITIEGQTKVLRTYGDFLKDLDRKPE